MQHELNLTERIPSLVLSPSVASIQRLPALSVMTDINFPMKGRKGMVDWARNSEDKVVIPKGIFLPQSAGNTTMMVMVVMMVMMVMMMNMNMMNMVVSGDDDDDDDDDEDIIKPESCIDR